MRIKRGSHARASCYSSRIYCPSQLYFCPVVLLCEYLEIAFLALSAMYSRVLFCACLVMILVAAYSLTCPTDCTQAACQPLTRLSCPHGVVLDPSCSCCYVCGKGPGDFCGGDDNLFGACGNGLECRVVPPPGAPTNLPSGISFPETCGECALIPSSLFSWTAYS